jgi:hypothetical protein
MEKKKKITVPDGYKLVFRPWITKNGKRLYASNFGLKAWPLLVPIGS